MSDWKNGDAAMVLCSDGEWRLALYSGGSGAYVPSWVFQDGTRRTVSDSEARQVAVLDSENPEHIDRLDKALDQAYEAVDPDGYANSDESTPEESLAIVRLGLMNFLTPPLDEPGLYGVVEAGSRTQFERDKWVRADFEERPWRTAYGRAANWSDLVDPVLIRDGVA